jgi:hypothetical protein
MRYPGVWRHTCTYFMRTSFCIVHSAVSVSLPDCLHHTNRVDLSHKHACTHAATQSIFIITYCQRGFCMSSELCQPAWICCPNGPQFALDKGTNQCALVIILAWPSCILGTDCKLTGCYMLNLQVACAHTGDTD